MTPSGSNGGYADIDELPHRAHAAMDPGGAVEPAGLVESTCTPRRVGPTAWATTQRFPAGYAECYASTRALEKTRRGVYAQGAYVLCICAACRLCRWVPLG